MDLPVFRWTLEVGIFQISSQNWIRTSDAPMNQTNAYSIQVDASCLDKALHLILVEQCQPGRRLGSSSSTVLGLFGPVGYCPSCLPPSGGPLSCTALPHSFPTSWLSDRLPTSHPLRCENPLQWKVCFVLSVTASQSKPVKMIKAAKPVKGEMQESWPEEGLDMCPGRQCGLSFPCLWTLPAPRPWHLNSLLDVRAVELSEHVHIEAGMGWGNSSYLICQMV